VSVRLVFVVALAALAATALPGRVGAANECAGIPRCIPVAGPWVAVPAHGEVKFALECPRGRGIVGGTDAQASSLDVRATFDGIIASPVSFGRTTLSSAFFRAVSATHRPGAFKPFIGCIPAENQISNTLSSKITPLGPPLDLKSKLVRVNPGFQRSVSVSCPADESLVDSWNATAFTAAPPPAPGLASAIRVQTKIAGHRATLSISVSEALPPASRAEVQVGVRCAGG
jgi:hypothetical protein